ncbi:MAG: NAD(P)/FAD-dependent oxidoreductase, partial [Clostridiales Family XIII bacterium]|nr:NAD(P)/FAD-dependent oxidoreductase [Clostridiales Family XIII bacterium]
MIVSRNAHDRCDFLIIGAGAAGLAAAVSYARGCGGCALVLDANAEAGKKIAATGNGRCNLSNTGADGYAMTRSFFESLGIVLSVDDGRVYPRNRQAACVRRALIAEAENLGVRILASTRVTAARAEGGGFVVSAKTESPRREASQREKSETARTFFSERLLIASGGKCTPAYGNLGDGFGFATKFGHSVKSILPVLVPLVYAERERKAFAVLKGVRARAKAELTRDGIVVAS